MIVNDTPFDYYSTLIHYKRFRSRISVMLVDACIYSNWQHHVASLLVIDWSILTGWWLVRMHMQEDQPQKAPSEPRPHPQGRVMAPGQYY